MHHEQPNDRGCLCGCSYDTNSCGNFEKQSTDRDRAEAFSNFVPARRRIIKKIRVVEWLLDLFD